MSYTYDVRVRRERLANIYTIIAFTAVVTVGLLLFFPKDQLLISLEGQRKGATITESYLNNIIKIYPNNKNLRFLLIEQQIRLHKFDDADASMSALRKQKLSRKEKIGLRWLQHLYVKAEAFKFPPDSKQRAQKIKQTGRIINSIANADMSLEKKRELAESAFHVGRPKLGLSIYYKLVNQGAITELNSYVEIAKLALGNGDYRHSALLYFQAERMSTSLDSKRKYFIAGVRSLQSGNYVREALEQAEKNIGGLSNDKETLMFLTELATAAGKVDVAQNYIQRVLELEADVPESTRNEVQ